MKRVLIALSVLVSLLGSMGQAFAQGIPLFAAHYRESILNFTPAQVSPQYLTIPRAGWPVHVQLSAVDPTTAQVAALTSFMLISGNNSVDMTIPVSRPLAQLTLCTQPGTDPILTECFLDGGSSVVSVGITDVSSSMPNRMFVRVSNCNCNLQVRITMWY